MKNNPILWNHVLTRLPKDCDREIVAYYSFPYKGARVSCYDVCTYNGSWKFKYPLPKNARVHSWQYLDIWMQSESALRLKSKALKKDSIKGSFSKDAQYQIRKHHCSSESKKERGELMAKRYFYEPIELVKMGIVFSNKRDAEEYSAQLKAEIDITIGKKIEASLSQDKLEELKRIRCLSDTAKFIEENCPFRDEIISETMTEFYTKTIGERLSIPNTVSLAKDDLQSISVDMLFLKPETTRLLKSAGFNTIGDMIHRYNPAQLEIILQEEEKSEIFNVLVELEYYIFNDEKYFGVYPNDKGKLHKVDDEQSCDEEATPITTLNLTSTINKQLTNAGIRTVEKLMSTSDDDLLRICHNNKKKLRIIQKNLDQYLGDTSLIEPPFDLDESLGKQASDWLNQDSEKNEVRNSMALLEELIGLKEVKQQVQKIAAFAKFKKNVPSDIKNKLSMVLNMAFVGNPGTAKTTVARILAGIFYENGITSSDELIEIGRADLVAKYTGQTAIKVQDVFRKAKGKLLFIDEAYSLVEDDGYSDEAIATIVQEMENAREDTIVIFAGYPDKMEDFLSKNPGLRSRVPFYIEFNDYSTDDLLKISELEANRRGFTISDNAKKDLASILTDSNKNTDGGNGRLCRNVIENAILNYAYRKYGGNNEAPVKDDFVLILEDFGISSDMENSKKTLSVSLESPEIEQSAKSEVESIIPDYLKEWDSIWKSIKKLS